MIRMRLAISGAAIAVIGAIGIWVWRGQAAAHGTPSNARYVAAGYGGYVPRSTDDGRQTTEDGRQTIKASQATSGDPLRAAEAAYDAGRYAEAEAEAGHALTHPPAPSRSGRGSITLQRTVAKARMVMAYAAARRKDLPLARERFAMAQQAAAKLPDRGKPESKIGENPPTLEEDAAYQHAVCTAAMGDQAEAENEYRRFMLTYPESPLAQAAVKRIARFHGGDVPAEAEADWKRAMQTARERQKARLRAQSMCGPECLAEVLERPNPPTPFPDSLTSFAGKGEDRRKLVRELAAEMGTSDEGTSLAALAAAANRRGFHARGLRLTLKGLQQQRLPVVAHVAPGHFVIVDRVTPDSVTVWDPDGKGFGKPAVRTYSAAEWASVWGGSALTLR